MTGPKRPQRPRTCRVPSEYLEQIRTEIGGTSERTAAHTITPAQAAKRQVKKAGSLKRPPKHRTLAAGETHKELIKPEESTAGKLNQRQQMAMEATMATAVPVVVALFSSRFAWFQKGWDRQPSGMKQQFMTEMKNELVKLRWYDDVSDIPRPSPPRPLLLDWVSWSLFVVLFPVFRAKGMSLLSILYLVQPVASQRYLPHSRRQRTRRRMNCSR